MSVSCPDVLTSSAYLALLTTNKFRSNKVGSREENPKSDKNAKIAPHVRTVIVETDAQVFSAFNIRAVRNCTSNTAEMLGSSDVLVTRTLRDVRRAKELTPIKLVNHE
jgi:hypothetical protein